MTSIEDGIRRCLAPFDVRVNVLCPGATVSSLTAGIVTGDKDNLVDAAVKMGAKYARGKAPMPRDMANAALFVASDESAFMNGAVIVIDSGKEVLSDRGRDKFYPAEWRLGFFRGNTHTASARDPTSRGRSSLGAHRNQ